MGKKKVLPTTQVINLFNALDLNEREIVFDYIRSRVTVQRPKSKPAAPKPAPAVAKKSLPASKSSMAAAANIGINGVGAIDAFNGIVGSSGTPQSLP
jgi:hypothetical protein